MKSIVPAAWLLICLLTPALAAPGVSAANAQEKPPASTTKPASNAAPAAQPSAKKAPQKTPQQKKAAKVKKRPPIASKSKSAREVAKTPLPPAKLDLSLPQDLVEEMKPVGTVPLPRHDAVLPQMFGDKAGSSPFQLNGRLLSNEMQLQLRNEERRDVEGAALDFEFKQ
jgi:hypothetical protein